MTLPRVAAVFTAMLAVLPLRLAALDLHLEDGVSETGKFSFTKTFTESVDPIRISRDAVVTSTPNYDIWMERDGVTEVPQFDYFHYELYVRAKTTPHHVEHVIFRGEPKGAFDDQFVNVHFTVDDGTIHDEGTIVLPIFGYVAPNVLSSPQPGEPAPVFLATDQNVSVSLTNELKRMPVTITGASVSPRDPTLWKAWEIRGPASGAFTPFLLAKGATTNDSLRIQLRPRTPQAFLAALIHGRNKEDDILTVSVKYKTLAREVRSFPIAVPVQFIPWPPLLVLLAMAGAPLGWLGLLAKAKHEHWRYQLKILGGSVIAAFFVEILGMLFVISGGEFKIFDRAVDPFQMLPATLIGVAAGLTGYQSLNFLVKTMNSFFKFGNPDTSHDAV